MKKTFIRILQFTVFLSLTVFLMYFITRGIDLKRIWNGLLAANYFWVAISMVIGILAFIFRAYRWNLLIEPLGHQPSVTNSYHAVAIGYIANILLPRLGEFSKCVSLNRTNRIPVDSLVGTILIERAIDMVTLFALLVLIFLWKFETFGHFISEKIFIPLFQKVLNLFHQSTQKLVFILLGVGVFILLLYIFRKPLSKIHLIRKIRKILGGILEGLKTVFQMKKRLQFFGATVGIWTCYFFMTYLIFFTIPETSGLTPIDALFLLVIGSFGMVVPVQGGFGAFHGMVILGLSLYGIGVDQAFLYAVLSHESQILMVIVVGVISLFKVFLSNPLKIKSVTSK